MTYPFVSVVVLNYNGLRFLGDCLDSLALLVYPPERYQVVLVDNVSTDGSVEAVEKRFPGVRVVRNGRNLGFAAGNNVAMGEAGPDYVVLLNNDTTVDRQWLSRLVEAAEQDPRVGACTSKLLFQHDRTRLELRCSPFRPRDTGSSDQRELGIQFWDARTVQGGFPRGVEFLEGFHGVEPSPSGPFRWSGARATLGLRLLHGKGGGTLRLRISAPRPDGATAGLELLSEGNALGRWEIGQEPRDIEVALPDRVADGATPVIQNAGTLILKDGSGRDRGTIVRGTEVYQEDDLGQYDRVEEVFGGCGAALLFRKAALEDVGLFDEDFFMYYEDMDLSWRLRRRGWKVLYVPGAVVRHLHAASSVEWSPLFLYNVERNRLLMLAKNAPLGMAASEHVKYLVSTATNAGRFARSLGLRAPDRSAVGRRLWIQLRVLISLSAQMPRTIRKRRQLRKQDRVSPAEMTKWMVSA